MEAQTHYEKQFAYEMANLLVHTVAAGTHGKDAEASFEYLKQGLVDEDVEKTATNDFNEMTDAQLAEQAKHFGVTLEFFKAQLKKGWKPMAKFTRG